MAQGTKSRNHNELFSSSREVMIYSHVLHALLVGYTSIHFIHFQWHNVAEYLLHFDRYPHIISLWEIKFINYVPELPEMPVYVP